MAQTDNITYSDVSEGDEIWFHHEGSQKHFDGAKHRGWVERVEDDKYEFPIKVRVDNKDDTATFIEPYEIDAILS